VFPALVELLDIVHQRLAGEARGGVVDHEGSQVRPGTRGYTLVRFSAQREPFLPQKQTPKRPQ
jgi:hypothetical protein